MMRLHLFAELYFWDVSDSLWIYKENIPRGLRHSTCHLVRAS